VKYKDFSAAMSGKTSRLAVVQDADGRVGVIGLMGEEIIPLSDTWRSVYDLNVSDDGSVILARLESGKYAVYTVNYDPDLSAVPVIDDGTWTCENGHAGNTGNFCTECGAKKPETTLTKCPDCGYEFGDSVPNFCPNCGKNLK